MALDYQAGPDQIFLTDIYCISTVSLIIDWSQYTYSARQREIILLLVNSICTICLQHSEHMSIMVHDGQLSCFTMYSDLLPDVVFSRYTPRRHEQFSCHWWNAMFVSTTSYCR